MSDAKQRIHQAGRDPVRFYRGTHRYYCGTIDRFASVQDFSSYARLVKATKSSAGKPLGAKIGSAHLEWAFFGSSRLLPA